MTVDDHILFAYRGHVCIFIIFYLLLYSIRVFRLIITFHVDIYIYIIHVVNVFYKQFSIFL